MRELGYFYPSLLYTLTCFKIGEPTPAGHYRYCTVLYHISPNIRELWLYKEVKQLYIDYVFFILSGLDRHGSLKLCTQLLCLFTSAIYAWQMMARRYIFSNVAKRNRR